MAFWDACHQCAGALVNAGCPSKPGGRDGVMLPQMPLRMPIAMLPRMLTRKAMKRASLAETRRISPTLVVISSAGRFDRKLAGVGDAESAGINSGWRNLSANENQGASINNHTACNGAADGILHSGRQRQGIIACGADVEPGLPELVEATARMDTAQGQDVFGTGFPPEHARLFAPGTNDGLAASFNDP